MHGNLELFVSTKFALQVWFILCNDWCGMLAFRPTSIYTKLCLKELTVSVSQVRFVSCLVSYWPYQRILPSYVNQLGSCFCIHDHPKLIDSAHVEFITLSSAKSNTNVQDKTVLTLTILLSIFEEVGRIDIFRNCNWSCNCNLKFLCGSCLVVLDLVLVLLY